MSWRRNMQTENCQEAGFEIPDLCDPFFERAPDEDGKSRWWVLIARKPGEKYGPIPAHPPAILFHTGVHSFWHFGLVRLTVHRTLAVFIPP